MRKKLLALAAIASVEASCNLPDPGRNEKTEECQSTWDFTEGERTITHYGFLPSKDGTAHKTFNDTFNFCQSHGLQSLVIHSQEHQVDVIQNLEEMIKGSGTGANMHSNFWLSMERDQITKEFNWKTWFKIPTIYDDYVEGYCPIDSKNGVEFWLTKPDANSISEHCAVMRINYNVTDNKNWETTACSTDQNGQLGESHGFVCVEDEDWNALESGYCAIIFPTTTTTTTTTKTATTSSGSGPEGPEGSGEGSTTQTSLTTSTKDPTDPNPDPNNPDNSSTSSSSTATTATTTTLESEDVNVGIIIGGVLGGLLFLGLLIFLIMRCLKPDNAVEDEEDQIDMSA